MDELDVSILRQLTQAGVLLAARPGRPPSYREVARNLGMRPETVGNRIKSMYDAGVLLGSTVFPNPNLLGLVVNAYALDVSPTLSKRNVIESLRSIEGMLFIQNFHGSLVGLVFASKNEGVASAKISKINSITGAEDGGLKTRALYPPCVSSLTKDQQRLVKLMSGGGFQGFDGLAKQLQTSLRTVKRSVSTIVRGNAILFLPTMDYTQITGVLPADLIVTFSSTEGKPRIQSKILEIVNDYTIYAGDWESFSLFSMMVPKVPITTEILEAVKRIEGVKTARLEFVDEHIDLANTLADLL